MANLAHPTRGERSAYARYLAGMDATMRQKVALTAAHLLCRGRVADMGMGSGSGSHALAALYPELEVVGVDVDPNMVELAREKYDLPNLSFLVGDIAAPLFEPASLSAIFDSSVLHHVTSFSGYDRSAAARALTVQAAALREHGVLVVRDFVDPGEGEVWLDLPADDGDDSEAPERCSTARLFERFSREFRSLSPQPGFPFERVEPGPDAPPLAPGRRRYRVSRLHAVELLLRKDYRRDWVSEAKEEYAYLTQSGFERVLEGLGLRVLASTPIRNPWIVANRLRGRYAMWQLDGRPLEHPATNYVIVGERVPAGEGVRFEEAGEVPRLGFLELATYQDRRTGRVRDLVRRPHTTLDVIPWFRAGADLHVVVRMSYPRPILASDRRGAPSIDGARAPHYVTEPLTLIQGDKPLGQTAEDFLTSLGVDAEDIAGVERGGRYYPSPGGVQEEVQSLLVELARAPTLGGAAGQSGFSTSGRVAVIEAQQLLRAAQVGGLPDARLELGVYELLAQSGNAPGPWIGDALALTEARVAFPRVTARSLASRGRRRAFRAVPVEQSSGFLALQCSLFRELAHDGTVVGEGALELVVPRPFGISTIAVALLARVGDQVLIGVDDDDLPAAQCFNGTSELLVAPAWRLPRELDGATPALGFVRERLRREYGLELGQSFELGGRYHPTPGVTPEVVHPFAFEVLGAAPAERTVTWIELRDLVTNGRELLLDGHLRVVANRAAHALALLG